MVTLLFTMPLPGKVSHHSPAPGKPPFFHHCYNDNNNFGSDNDDNDLGGSNGDNNDGNDFPLSRPPQLSCPQRRLIDFFNLFDSNHRSQRQQ
jgi:hypothetical protein